MGAIFPQKAVVGSAIRAGLGAAGPDAIAKAETRSDPGVGKLIAIVSVARLMAMPRSSTMAAIGDYGPGCPAGSPDLAQGEKEQCEG
jgi:hypothetical protein